MSNKITSLKFTNPRKKKISFRPDGETLKYEIYWNTNNDASTLDISIHDLLDVNRTDKDFNYDINSGGPFETEINPEDVVVRKKTGGGIKEVIYQFSVDFSDFRSNADN